VTLGTITPKRNIIKIIEMAGFASVKIYHANQKKDIRDIVAESLELYQSRFMLAFALYIPVFFAMWVLPQFEKFYETLMDLRL
jgi:hypothetical protein